MTRSQVATTVKKLRVATSSTHPLASTSTIRGHQISLDQPAVAGGSDSGPSPMEAVLASVLGCTQVIVSRTAQDLGITVGSQHAYALALQDDRGQRGVTGVQTYFDQVALQIAVSVEAGTYPESALKDFAQEVHRRCPGLNLLADANVKLDVVWDFASSADASVTEYRLHERLDLEARVEGPTASQLPHTSISFAAEEVSA
ncbi:OsmC family protein [Micrococcoides hystricis]|uniref:OsmC family protein n=1 Tax=Micrococcoides hystricis TaxID=1572761 RepID=A0ABV6PAN9_9MICC